MSKKKKAIIVEPDEVGTRTKRGGMHPKHPPCPECGRAMYKTMSVGKAVKKIDPWAFCRNKNCSLHGVNQSEETIEETKIEETIEETKTEEAPKESLPKPKVEKKVEKKVLTKEEKKKRRKSVVNDLLSEEFSHAEIARRNKCSRKYVKGVSLKILSEG